MRLILSTFIAFFVCALFFFIIKFWGQSQYFSDYRHPLLAPTSMPLVFHKVRPADAAAILRQVNEHKNLYFDVAATMDKKLVVVDKPKKAIFNYHAKTLSEVKGSAYPIEDLREALKGKVVIFNMVENPIFGTPVFLDALKTLGMENGENFIFLSPYDPPIKDLKEVAPTYLYGTSEPEILKIKAMESLFLLDALTLRADIVVHTLNYYERPFFTQDLRHELFRRHRRFIVGPISDDEEAAAQELKPYGIIKQEY